MSSDSIVFIVDDDPAACASVAAVIEAHGFRTEAFNSAEQFLQSYDGAAGCVIADLRMPGMGGLELQQQLAARPATPPVILISAYADVPTTVRAMQSGAVTLLEKPYGEQELTEAVTYALELDRQGRAQRARKAELQRRMAELTSGERQVLTLLVEGATNKAIASRLDIGLRTVEKYRHNLFKKLSVNSLPELVRLVIEWEELGAATDSDPPSGDC